MWNIKIGAIRFSSTPGNINHNEWQTDWSQVIDGTTLIINTWIIFYFSTEKLRIVSAFIKMTNDDW